MIFYTWVLAACFGVVLGLALLLVLMVVRNSPFPMIVRSDREKKFYNPTSGDYEDFPTDLSDPPSIHLSVVVPSFDEEKRLPPMLDETLEFLEKRSKSSSSFKYEIIIVSDGSRDRTVAVGQEYVERWGSEKIRVLDLKPNRGKGGAVRLGVLSSRGAMILFADADGATKFADLKSLENQLSKLIGNDYTCAKEEASSKFGVAVGSRAHLEEGDSLVSRSFFRTFLQHGFHWGVRLLTVRTVKDTQCGFKLFTRATADVLFKSVHVERWAFDVELLYLAEHFNIPIAEVPVNWVEIDGSKVVPVFTWLQMGIDVFLIWLKYRAGIWKTKKRANFLKKYFCSWQGRRIITFYSTVSNGIEKLYRKLGLGAKIRMNRENGGAYISEYSKEYPLKSNVYRAKSYKPPEIDDHTYNAIADPFKQLLLPDYESKGTEEKATEFYDKVLKRKPSIVRVVPGPVDQAVLEDHNLVYNSSRSLYQVDYCLPGHYVGGPSVRPKRVPMPAKWEPELTTYRLDYRDHNGVAKWPLQPRPASPPPSSLDPNPIERKILKVVTGKSEYQDGFGSLGEEVIRLGYHGKISPLPGEYVPPEENRVSRENSGLVPAKK